MAQDKATTAVEQAYPPVELVRVRDGLRLAVRRYRPARSAMAKVARRVVCLPGLTRNSRDFHVLAAALASDPVTPREVVAIDARGRGHSDHDPDWKNYVVPVETQDIVDVYAALGLHGSAIIGTSRGGLQTMVLGAIQPAALGPVVLNDIGPVIERDGLARIGGYVGKGALPASWAEATAALVALGRTQFPAVAPETWATVARQLYNEGDGKPAPGYDPALGKGFSVFDGPPPALWAQFGTLRAVPLLILRGELSDLLSVETVRQMETRHPNVRAITIRGEGHAPLLMDAVSISAIKDFLVRTDG
jgi:pimeloyl-ACP methyl ester carboxylesterase